MASAGVLNLFTWLRHRRMEPLTFSTTLVVPKDRTRRGGSPSRLTAKVFSSPSRSEREKPPPRRRTPTSPRGSDARHPRDDGLGDSLPSLLVQAELLVDRDLRLLALARTNAGTLQVQNGAQSGHECLAQDNLRQFRALKTVHVPQGDHNGSRQEGRWPGTRRRWRSSASSTKFEPGGRL